MEAHLQVSAREPHEVLRVIAWTSGPVLEPAVPAGSLALMGGERAWRPRSGPACVHDSDVLASRASQLTGGPLSITDVINAQYWQNHRPAL